MRKLSVLLIVFVFAVLAGCAKSGGDDLAKYRKFSSKEIYDQANKELSQKKYKTAAKRYDALNTIYPFGPYARQAQLNTIYAYYMTDDDALALAAADRYIRLFPRGQDVDYAYYMKGMISFRQGLTWMQQKLGVDPAPRDLTNKRKSFVAFSEVVNRFPRSAYAEDSALHMAYIRNIIARKQVIISEFYFERDAYVAAANRASYVVEHFQGSPQVIPALALMVKSYRKLHLNKLADNTMKIFAASYPNSKQYKDLADHA